MNNTLEQVQHKMKQLKEALELVEDIGSRLDWASDFCEYGSIKNIIDPLNWAVYKAQEELEDMESELEERLEQYNEKKKNAEEEFEQEYNHLLVAD